MSLRDKIAKMQSTINLYEKTIAELTESIESIQKSLDNANTALLDSCTEEQKLKETLNAALDMNASLQSRIDELLNTNDDLLKAIEWKNTEIKELDNRIYNNHQHIHEIKDDARSKLKVLHQAIQQLIAI